MLLFQGKRIRGLHQRKLYLPRVLRFKPSANKGGRMIALALLGVLLMAACASLSLIDWH